MGRPRKYNTEEERKAAQRKSQKQYHQNHKDEIAEQQKQYRSTPNGRATMLLSGYKRDDKEYNRGECTLTADWIVENVFSGQCCNYCVESDWAKLGVDRKDSSLPHTKENCVPCCRKCNEKKHTTEYQEFMRLIGKIV